MRDELLGYYERELIFLRQMGAEFAEKYPKVAGRLLLEADKCEDPHVERLIEAFSFLTSRVHLKIDDEFPEITESFLNVLYPHYLAPIPSMSIAQFGLDPQQGKLTSGYRIDRETTLYSRPVNGTPCRFRTSYPVTLWPFEVSAVSLQSLDPVGARGKWSEAMLKISLRCLHNTKLSELKVNVNEKEQGIEDVRFYLNGEAQLVYPLYELLFNDELHVQQVELLDTKTRRSIKLTPGAIRPVGFEADEGMLGYTPRSFLGYRLLTEYFAFPDKFLFFDVLGLDKAAAAGFGDQFDLQIYLKDVTPPRAKVDASTFQLGCTPIINMFQKVAEPIQLTQQQHEYHVIPDVHRQSATEIYSIDSVTTVDSYLQQSREFQPFYSYRHSYERDQQGAFWYGRRRNSQRAEDEGTEIYLSFVDLNFSPRVPPSETVTCHVTCTNRDLPARLPFGGREGDFEVENAGPLARVKCLRKPTETLRPPLRRGAHWRLISHLSLNHLSIVEGQRAGDPEALREILMLYDFMDSAATRKQIIGLTKINSRRVVRQTGSRIGTGFVRGIETTMEFNEDQFVGSGVFLFAAVLERFLGLYASVNSFNQLLAKTEQREGYLKKWKPRTGEIFLA